MPVSVWSGSRNGKVYPAIGDVVLFLVIDDGLEWGDDLRLVSVRKGLAIGLEV